jgi:YVTN family beta-propeller protein
VAVTPDGTKVYVGVRIDGSVKVIATATNNMIDSISVGGSPRGLAVTPDGQKVYVADGGGNTVSVIDMDDNSVQTVTVGDCPFGLAVTPDGVKVYAANSCGDTVSVIETANNNVQPVTVGLNPQGLAVTSDGTRVYVANSDSNSATVIDTSNDTVIDTNLADPNVRDIQVGNRPVAFGQFISFPLDKDGDEIQDLVDRSVDVNGNFVNESNNPNNKSFTNQHLCGTIFGSIVSVPSGMVVKVGSPAGIVISAFGGAGQAQVNACGFDLLYDPNDVTVINSCGSLTAQVLVGPVEILLDSVGAVTVPPGATVRVEEVADEQFEVRNLGSTGTIVVEFQGDVTELTPGSSGTFPDNCPDDPGKTDPGVCGCGMADADSDGDGIEDCIDGCSADPDKTDPGVCGCGVADADDDGNGIPDCIDQLCPCGGPVSGEDWKNHGEYVSCVTQAVEDPAVAGLITEEEKGDIVSDAAQSDCGKKK